MAQTMKHSMNTRGEAYKSESLGGFGTNIYKKDNFNIKIQSFIHHLIF